MKTNRRNFISTVVTGGLAVASIRWKKKLVLKFCDIQNLLDSLKLTD